MGSEMCIRDSYLLLTTYYLLLSNELLPPPIHIGSLCFAFSWCLPLGLTFSIVAKVACRTPAALTRGHRTNAMPPLLCGYPMTVPAASSRLSVGLGVAFVTGNVCGWAEAALMSAAAAGGGGSASGRCLGPSSHIRGEARWPRQRS